jgi:hypothetical protein
MTTGWYTCCGTFCGPVGTIREASKEIPDPLPDAPPPGILVYGDPMAKTPVTYPLERMIPYPSA